MKAKKFQISRQLNQKIDLVAAELRAGLRHHKILITRSVMTAAITDLVMRAAKQGGGGELTASATPVGIYNRAGDALALAYQTFQAGHLKNGLEMAALAFEDPSCSTLINAIVANNDETSDDKEGDTHEFSTEEDAEAPADNSTAHDHEYRGDDDDDDDDNNSYIKKLNKAVDSVTADLMTADDDDGELNLNDDDAAVLDADTTDDDDDDLITADDDDNGDGELSLNDDNVDDDDDNDDDDVIIDPPNTEDVVGDNVPAMISKLTSRIKDRSIIAAANRISQSGKPEDRKKALRFLASAVNVTR